MSLSSPSSPRPARLVDGVKKAPFAIFRGFVREYRWIHLGLGLLGNTAFVVGSVMFLWESLKTPAIWLFIIGSSGMLIESIGSALVKYEEQREHKRLV